MLAFHGKPEIKATYLARVEAHRAADQLIRGTYWKWDDDLGGYRGCAVGCTVHSDDHDAYEMELGIPTAIAYLEDRIFEGLPIDAAMAWPALFLSAIPVGADLSGVVDRLMLWLLAPDGYNLARYTARADGLEAIARVHALYVRKVAGDAPTEQEWEDAANAAHAAAYAAAYTTYTANAVHAAAYAANAPTDAAAHAAYAAAHAAAYTTYTANAAHAAANAAASAAAYEQIADYLIGLLAGSPVIAGVPA